MADYKAPASRKAIKSKVKALLMDWLDENLDDSGDTGTIWDSADDAAARSYDSEIEDDKSHTQAMKVAKERFWDELKDDLQGSIEEVFSGLGE